MVFGCSCNKTIEYRNVNLRNCFYNFYSIVLDVSLFTKTDTRRPVSLRQLRGALYSYRVHLIPLISMSATKQQSFAPPPPLRTVAPPGCSCGQTLSWTRGRRCRERSPTCSGRRSARGGRRANGAATSCATRWRGWRRNTAATCRPARRNSG